MVDTILAMLVAVLLATTVAAAVYYFRMIRRAGEEYRKGKEVVEDVILSFNRQLKRETDRFSLVAYKTEGNNSRIETLTKSLKNLENIIAPLEEKLAANTEETRIDLAKFMDVNNKMILIEETNNKLKDQITELEGQIQKLISLPETRIETVIPIKRDKAVSSLTNTEIAVLEFLSNEGPKTAPEIKEKVQLSREHTARLMKKLYEEGYLERETGKIPFMYSVKKEMEKLLSKSTPQPPST